MAWHEDELNSQSSSLVSTSSKRAHGAAATSQWQPRGVHAEAVLRPVTYYDARAGGPFFRAPRARFSLVTDGRSRVMMIMHGQEQQEEEEAALMHCGGS